MSNSGGCCHSCGFNPLICFKHNWARPASRITSRSTMGSVSPACFSSAPISGATSEIASAMCVIRARSESEFNCSCAAAFSQSPRRISLMRSWWRLPGCFDDCVEVNLRTRSLRVFDRLAPGIQTDAERVQRAQNQPYTGARFAFLDLDNPLSTDAHLLRQFALIEVQLSAGFTNETPPVLTNCECAWSAQM